MSILIGHGIHSDWSWHLFQLVTAIFLMGHNVHSNWSQYPFRLVTVSILIYQDIILLSAHAVAVAKYFAYHPFCP